MSAPKSFARCRYGVATVWSITSGTPAARATAATERMSSTCAFGLVIDSANSARVVGRTAAAQASASSWSTNVTSMPQSANVSCSRSIGAAVQLLGRDDVLALLRQREQRERDRGLPGSDRRSGDAALELGDALLEHEHGRVGRATVDVALASEREQVARLAQRGELERVRLIDRRDGGVLGDTGHVARLHLRRREGTGGLGHPTIVEQARPFAPVRVSNCCAERRRCARPTGSG